MKVLIASSEVVPFAKTGGLADVTGALPGELAQLGHKVIVIMPAYRAVKEAGFTLESTGIELEIPIGDHSEKGTVLRSTLPNQEVPIFFVDQSDFFDRPGIYGEGGSDYADNCERFTFFSRAILECIRLFDWQTELVHLNDWQTSLVAALLKCEYHDHLAYSKIASLITIHNLAYQGLFPRDKMPITGLDPIHFNWQEMEFHGKLNLLKTGLIFADSINTVSPTYSLEIQTELQGCGLEGVLGHRADVLTGILNGIDTAVWNPSTDEYLVSNYDECFEISTGCQGKTECKLALQKEFQLESNPEIPMIGIIGRLAAQKGWSLILPVLRNFLAEQNVQWVILGTGDPDYHHALMSLHRSYPHRMALTLGFSNELAHRIESGADIFLMPSEFEPCGLNQMYSMAYGTVPIVRQTGGLTDTVIDVTPDSLESKSATGFCFEEFSATALGDTVEKAIRMYRQDQNTWRQIMINGMSRDWSWKASAEKYATLYRQTQIRKHHQD